MRTGLLIFSLCLATALQLSIAQDESCTRGDGKTGYCVRRNQCAQFVSIINRRKLGFEYTADEVTYIRNSRCPGKKISQGLACCEDDEKVAEGIQMLRDQDCGQVSIEKTIGGKEVGLMSRPWMVYLLANDTKNYQYTCGGTLINNRYVLTAAHCLRNRSLHSVRLGEHNLRIDPDCKIMRGREKCAPQVLNILNNQVFLHEGYSPITKQNDIALVKLSADVTFTNSVKPICLPLNETLQELTKSMEKFLVAGWGEVQRNQVSDVLTETVVSNMDIAACTRSYYRTALTSTQICAGDIGSDACNGDSGGPLAYVTNLYDGYQRFVQFGITSFGSPTCGDRRPSVYTNVGSYIRWIAYKIATK